MLTQLEINLSALSHNVEVLRQQIGSGRSICAVVKANAYGHGLLPIAKHLVTIGVERLAITSFHDLLLLRREGITLPIHLMSILYPHEYLAAVQAQVIPFISSLEEAIAWQEAAEALKIEQLVHLKINSHMNRLGVDPEEESALLEYIQQAPHLRLEGLCLHLARADEEDQASMKQDIHYIERLANQLRGEHPHLICHVANSAAISNYPSSLFQMIRPGLALYGYQDGRPLHQPLEPILQWKSHLIHLRKVAANRPISYGSTYHTKEATTLGIIPVGYADGYPREFLEESYVVIHGELYPVIGRVCMNQLIVDLGNEVKIQLYDPVYLLDRQQFTASHLAQKANSITHKILSTLNPQIERIYTMQHSEAQ